MPTDAKFPFEFDATGDVETASGQQFYENHALQLAMSVAYNHRGSSMSPNEVEDLSGDVKRKLGNSPYFEQPVLVEAEVLDTEELQLRVSARNTTEFEVEV